MRENERARRGGDITDIVYLTSACIYNRNDVIAVDSRCYVGRMKECVSFYAFPDIQKPRAVESRIYRLSVGWRAMSV